MKRNSKKPIGNQTVGNLATQEVASAQTLKHDPTYIQALLSKPTEVNGAKFCTLPVNMLEVDHSYQRPAALSVVKRIAETWDSTKAGTLLVNFRDERFYVMDGQHRMEAAKLAGIGTLYCMVSIGKTRDEEIEVFVNQNVNVTKMSTYDYFYARCSKNLDPFALGMKELFDKYHVVYANPHAGQRDRKGKTISRTPSPGTAGRLGGISTMMKIGEDDGFEMVDMILSMIEILHWHTLRNAYSSTILSAFEYAFKDRDAMMVQDKLYRALHTETPDTTVIKARSERPSVGRVAAVKAKIDSILK